MEWNTTTGLLDALRDFRNEDAWASVVERFRPAIAAFARRLGVRDADLEDTIQEVLLAFATAYAEGRYQRERGPLRTWLFTIAYRRIVDGLRARSQRAAIDRPAGGDDAVHAIPEPATVASTWDQEWEALLLAECLRRVRQQVREKTVRAFEMLVLEERDPEEVARALDLSRNAVYIAKFRVLERIQALREELEGGGASSAGREERQ